MHRKSIAVIFLIVIVFSVFFYSCRKSMNPSWDTDILVPLVKSSLTINNIIPDTLLQTNSNNYLDIVYQSSLSAFSANSIFLIPDTTADTTITIPSLITFSPCSTIILPSNDETQYNIKNVELTKIIIRSGKMKINVINNTDGNLAFNYSIPLASLNSHPFDTTFIAPKRTNATTPYSYSITFDLSGYSFDLTGLNHNSFNTIVKNTSVKVPCSEPQLNLIGGDYLKIENSFISIVPQYAKGYFGSSITHVSNNTNLSLFKHIISGSLGLQSVNIGLNIENSVGDDFRMTIDSLLSVNSRTGITKSLSPIPSPININRAVDNNGNVAASTYSISFTPSNSNILTFVENLPDKLVYKMDFEINPLGYNVSGNNDFIYYDKLIKTNLNMTIPLSLIANNLTMADTMNFTMNSNLANVNSGNLYLYFENGFPFIAQAQLFLMNNNSVITDSLISAPNVISAPPLDINSICVGQRETKLTIPIGEGKLNELRSSKKMYIKIKFNTANQPNYVKVYNFYEMKFKVVGDFNYTVGKKN